MRIGFENIWYFDGIEVFSLPCAKDNSCVISKFTSCCNKLYGMERKHWNGSSVFQGWPCVPADCGRDRYQLVGQRR